MGKRQAAVLLTPGTIPGLVPGSAAAEWWNARIAHAGQLAHHVDNLQADASPTPGSIPGLVSGSPAAAEWWNARIAHAGQLAHHVVKRQATDWPAGVSPAACPNYPYCGLSAIVPDGYVNTGGYPAGASAAVCPGYPYC